MSVLVTIPIELYHGLLGRCEISSKEYRCLKNGIVTDAEKEGDGDIEVKILCQNKDAEELLDWAKKLYPEASSQITLDLHPKL